MVVNECIKLARYIAMFLLFVDALYATWLGRLKIVYELSLVLGSTR